jgi:hypothetical protein
MAERGMETPPVPAPEVGPAVVQPYSQCKPSPEALDAFRSPWDHVLHDTLLRHTKVMDGLRRGRGGHEYPPQPTESITVSK